MPKGVYDSKNRVIPNRTGASMPKEAKLKIKENNAKYWLGKKLSLDHRRKLSISHITTGSTSTSVILRNSVEYKLWRKSVFERDEYTCVWCGIKFIKGVTGRIMIHADHIKPFAYFPELRFAIDNGRTLCVSCHKTTDTYGSKVHSYRK